MKSLKILLVLFVFLTSCSKKCADCQDCEDCEKRLKMCVENSLVPVKLPDYKSFSGEQTDEVISIIITEDERCLIEEKEYELDELQKVLKEISVELKTRKIKIKASPSAKYSIIFELLAIMKKNEFKPVLAILEK